LRAFFRSRILTFTGESIATILVALFVPVLPVTFPLPDEMSMNLTDWNSFTTPSATAWFFTSRMFQSSEVAHEGLLENFVAGNVCSTVHL
jgi:hypothetical protein